MKSGISDRGNLFLREERDFTGGVLCSAVF